MSLGRRQVTFNTAALPSGTPSLYAVIPSITYASPSTLTFTVAIAFSSKQRLNAVSTTVRSEALDR